MLRTDLDNRKVKCSLFNIRYIRDIEKVFASICEHAKSALIFASASSDQLFSHASSEHFRISNGEQRALRKFPAIWNLSLLKRCCVPSNLADTFKTGQQA